jgi:cytochrome P450
VPTRPLDRPRPPGPAGERWVGNLAAYEADRLGFLLATRAEHGDLVAFDGRTTLVHGPELVSTLLRDRSGVVGIDQNFLQQRLSVVAADEVFRHRALLNPGLRPAAVLDVAPHVERLTHEHLSARTGGVPFDPLPVLERVISTAVAEHFFGAEGTPLPAQTARLLDSLAQVIGNPWALPASFPTPTRSRIKRQHLELRSEVVRLLERRVRGSAAYDDLAARVLAGRAHTDVEELPLTRVADLLIGSLLAAQRVPAAAAAWVLMLVADHPAWQPRARDDESSARAVVLEALRLYPPTWVIMRLTRRPVELGGYSFEAGHHFLLSPYVVHRDPRVFDEAGRFRPERWLGRRTPPECYLPFGVGRHRCPGVNLATVALVALVRAVLGLGEVSREAGAVAPDARTTLLPRGLRIQLRAGSPRALAG